MAVNARAIRKHFLVWLIAGVAIALACMLATAQGAAGKPFAMQLVVFFGIVGAQAPGSAPPAPRPPPPCPTRRARR